MNARQKPRPFDADAETVTLRRAEALMENVIDRAASHYDAWSPAS
jgi:hypothetical protein